MRIERKLFFWAGIFTGNGVITEDITELLSMLNPELKLELWLIVDIPKTDFFRIAGSGELAGCFHKVLYLEECGGAEAPGVFDCIVEKSGGVREECLVLDFNLKRAVAAINNRLPAAVVIDNEHIKREFLLRRLSNQVYFMHKQPV